MDSKWWISHVMNLKYAHEVVLIILFELFGYFAFFLLYLWQNRIIRNMFQLNQFIEINYTCEILNKWFFIKNKIKTNKIINKFHKFSNFHKSFLLSLFNYAITMLFYFRLSIDITFFDILGTVKIVVWRTIYFNLF